MLTAKDLERLQAYDSDDRMDLVNGEIIVMSPSGYESEEIATELARQLGNWVKPRQLGRVTGSGAGFILPNADTRAPDVSFVLADRLRQSPKTFAELAPDLMVEVKSPTDQLAKLRHKIDQFLILSTRIGILIDPDERWVEVRRLHQSPVKLQDGDILTLPDLLPGWELPIGQLWPPIFE